MNAHLNNEVKEINETHVKDLQNVARLANNVLTLLNDGSFAGKYAGPLMEAQSWLDGMRKAIEEQIAKAQPVKPEVVEAEIAK